MTKGGKQFLGYTWTLRRVRIGVAPAVAMTAFMLAGCTHDGGDAGEAAPAPSSTQPDVATLGRWIEHPTKFMHCTGVTGGGVIDYAAGRGADTPEGAARYAFATMYDQVPYHLHKVSSGTLPHGDGFAQYIAFGKDHSVAFTTANLDPKNLTWRASYVADCEHHKAIGITAGPDSVSVLDD